MCVIDRGFVVTDARGLVANLARLRVNPRFAQHILGSKVCVHGPKIIAQKLESEVCAAKSSDGPNPYFAHNKYIRIKIWKKVIWKSNSQRI